MITTVIITQQGDVMTHRWPAVWTVPPTIDQIRAENPTATIYPCAPGLFLWTDPKASGYSRPRRNGYATHLAAVLGHTPPEGAPEGAGDVYGDAYAVLADRDAEHLAAFATGFLCPTLLAAAPSGPWTLGRIAATSPGDAAGLVPVWRVLHNT